MIWDVGAHDGSWAASAHEAFPDAEIHAFEIVPETRQALERLAERSSWLHTHDFGLSDADASVCVTVSSADSTISSITPRFDHWTFQAGSTETVESRVVAGDDLISAGTIPAPHVLKIDVEGHEIAVLRGLRGLLAGDERPRLIQFEYGSTYVRAGARLLEAYELLEPAGYSIGRVYPEHVEFEPYRVDDEHFRMGNYVACRDAELTAALAEGA